MSEPTPQVRSKAKHDVVRLDFFRIGMEMKDSLASVRACSYEAGLICQNAFDQTTSSVNQSSFESSCVLLSMILSKIEVDPKWYDKFLSVLRKVDLGDTADRLYEAFREEESRQHEDSSACFSPMGQSTPLGPRRHLSNRSNDSGYADSPKSSERIICSDYDKIIMQKNREIDILERAVEDLKKNKTEMEKKIVYLRKDNKKEIQRVQDSWKKKLQELEENLENALTDLDDAKLALNNAEIERGREIKQLRRKHLLLVAEAAEKELYMEEQLADLRENELIAMRGKLVEEKQKRAQHATSQAENDSRYANL